MSHSTDDLATSWFEVLTIAGMIGVLVGTATKLLLGGAAAIFSLAVVLRLNVIIKLLKAAKEGVQQ